MRNWTSPTVSTEQVQTIQAQVHRLQRIHEDEALQPGEFTDVIRCPDDTCTAIQHGNECSHAKVIGVYRAVPLGTIVGGTFLQKVESYLRIKLANLIHGYRSN